MTTQRLLYDEAPSVANAVDDQSSERKGVYVKIVTFPDPYITIDTRGIPTLAQEEEKLFNTHLSTAIEPNEEIVGVSMYVFGSFTKLFLFVRER